MVCWARLHGTLLDEAHVVHDVGDRDALASESARHGLEPGRLLSRGVLRRRLQVLVALYLEADRLGLQGTGKRSHGTRTIRRRSITQYLLTPSL